MLDLPLYPTVNEGGIPVLAFASIVRGHIYGMMLILFFFGESRELGVFKPLFKTSPSLKKWEVAFGD